MRRHCLTLLLVLLLSGCSIAPADRVPVSAATATPSPAPTALATKLPTVIPTEAPTEVPTAIPTDEPTEMPTGVPTEVPTETLTAEPQATTIAASNSPIDVARGAELFAKGANGAPPCSTCHLTQVGQTGFSLGPNLAGVGERAGARVEGEGIDAYLHQSIVEPNSYLVPGYRSIMYPEYGKHYSESELQELIDFLKSL